MTMYAEVEDLQARLDWTLTMPEILMAEAALEDLSEWAIHYGREWPEASPPALIKRLVLSAAARFMRNPEGLDTSRAGDETMVWQRSENAGSATFNRVEISAIQRIARPHSVGLHSLQISAWDSTPSSGRIGWVPSADGTKPFPLFADPQEPW